MTTSETFGSVYRGYECYVHRMIQNIDNQPSDTIFTTAIAKPTAYMGDSKWPSMTLASRTTM